MSKKKRIIGVSLTVVLVLLVFLAGYSFAKYYTEIDGAGKGTIAKWSFNAGNGGDTIADISLQDTAKEVSLVSDRIAPGTRGNFDIIIDATGSEVGVDYKVEVLSESNLPQNMKYYVTREDNSESDKYDSLTALAQTELEGKMLVGESQIKMLTVNWEWPYEDILNEESYDLADIQAGTNADLEYKFVLQITGTQSAEA